MDRNPGLGVALTLAVLVCFGCSAQTDSDAQPAPADHSPQVTDDGPGDEAPPSKGDTGATVTPSPPVESAPAEPDEPAPPKPAAPPQHESQPTPPEPRRQEPKPQEPKPQEPKPQEPKPQEPRPQEPEPQQPKPQEPKPQEPKPQEPEPKEPESAPEPPAPPRQATPAPIPDQVAAVVDIGGPVEVPAPKPGLTRIGADKCKICHKVQFASWAQTAHATRTPPLDCEGCHGPGSEYKSKKVMEDPEAARAAGLVAPDRSFCRQCHTGEWSDDLMARSHAHKVETP